ncbi:MAG: T9SS type A sorting domain-containing protein [Muribaculaceae bacterium]|nr:T9SS type A sorting domain-containing protein [Muribaculaceae bacterium]MDE6134817.1 T9SS type A sorting domain-containing protein [Muribaculaceae bacterium]
MKKLYISLAAALLGVASLNARELTFYLGDTPISADETVTFTDYSVEPAGASVEVVMAPKLSLHSDLQNNKINITATCTSGQEVQMCAGGLCQTGAKISKSDISIGTNAKLDLEFEYIGILKKDETIPEVVTEFEAEMSGYTSTYKKFTLVMNPSAGVATLIGDNNSFRAINGGIEYNIAEPSTVELYSITGRKVLSTTLSGEGTMSTSELPRGIYVYTIAGKSGKIYVR